MPSKHFLIFSHGFGVRSDSRGLFSDIAGEMESESYTPVFIELSRCNEDGSEMIILPYSEQAARLRREVEIIQDKYPDATIDIIGHSQGSAIVTLAGLKNTRKIILLAPFFHTDKTGILTLRDRYADDDIDFVSDTTKRRKNGGRIIIPAAHWQERISTDLIKTYNEFGVKNNVTIIAPESDEVCPDFDIGTIKSIPIITIPGDHNFNPPNRENLLQNIKKLLLN